MKQTIRKLILLAFLALSVGVAQRQSHAQLLDPLAIINTTCFTCWNAFNACMTYSWYICVRNDDCDRDWICQVHYDICIALCDDGDDRDPPNI